MPTLRKELHLHYLLFQLSNKLRLILVDAIRPFSTTVPRYRALQQLYDHGALRLTDLAAECALESSAMTHVVSQLVRAGLVARKRGGEDNRTVMIHSTPRGRALYAQMAQEAMHIHRTVTHGLSPKDRKTLADLLRRMMHNADGMMQPSAVDKLSAKQRRKEMPRRR